MPLPRTGDDAAGHEHVLHRRLSHAPSPRPTTHHTLARASAGTTVASEGSQGRQAHPAVLAGRRGAARGRCGAGPDTPTGPPCNRRRTPTRSSPSSPPAAPTTPASTAAAAPTRSSPDGHRPAGPPRGHPNRRPHPACPTSRCPPTPAPAHPGAPPPPSPHTPDASTSPRAPTGRAPRAPTPGSASAESLPTPSRTRMNTHHPQHGRVGRTRTGPHGRWMQTHLAQGQGSN